MGARDMVKKLVPTRLFMAIEPLGHWAEAVVWNIAMGFPSRGLKVIGVTGTDGKTSTSTLITQMLRENGLSVAMMTTISVDYGDGRGEVPNPTRLTTMGARDLLQKIKKIKANNVNWLVLETTSHALAQHRVWGVPYGIAVFTNLGHEHLDYHKTFERYRDAKRLLFKQTNANKKGLRIGIVNADDGVASYFASDIANPMMYGIKNGEYRATNIKMTPQGSSYTVKTKDQTYHITCHVPGSFNVYNSLAAVCVGQAIGLNKEQIQKGIAGLKAVEGRMTRVDEGQDFDVIVDY
ncbi:UDP-N-acetylmuramoyl-L-alanyl-D-glutamate--2,6-diaminopimelate ligase, partial [bacterium]|nr:UDP-N-acetylmuramoyl-L-alanyl-D-glutamate--2,6-diaminopimelate ligase [bacterium]